MPAFKILNNTVCSKIKIEKYMHDGRLMRLLTKLNSFDTYDMPSKNELNSIMEFENICDHDDGFLCEHRIEWILDYIIENFKDS